MQDNIKTMVENAKAELKGICHKQMVEAVRTKYLGKNGLLVRSLTATESLPASVRGVRKRVINNAIRDVDNMIKKVEKNLL